MSGITGFIQQPGAIGCQGTYFVSKVVISGRVRCCNAQHVLSSLPDNRELIHDGRFSLSSLPFP